VLVLLVAVVAAAGKLMSSGQEASPAPTAPQAASPPPRTGTTAAISKSVVWDCANAKDPSRLWRRMQFDEDGVYSYVGDATGTPSWGRWSKDSESVMQMIAGSHGLSQPLTPSAGG
jgi:hypothetical protein